MGCSIDAILRKSNVRKLSLPLMSKIEGIRIKNFKVLKDITLGKIWNTPQNVTLTPLTVVIGKNGVGKSTLFDAIGFLSDCLKNGVEEACDLRGRGGFEKIRSKGQEGSIDFEIYFREEPKSRPITYELSIDVDGVGRPYVKRERLRQRRKGQNHGWPFTFLYLKEGKGIAWAGDSDGTDDIKEDENEFEQIFQKYFGKSKRISESKLTEKIELDDKRKLGIATVGSLKQHPRISALRKFIEGWYLSYFTPDAARSLPLVGPQKHLNIHGDNLANVVQFMEREQPNKFKNILNNISKKIPGIKTITTERSPDGRLLLCFKDRGFIDPFYAQQMSDGTLKMFAYMILLDDPDPPPFLCIEEPENGLYHKLLELLAKEFRDHANGRKGGSQIFVTTHQPYFVNELEPNEVWILEKQEDGFSSIRRASEDPLIVNLASEGLNLGNLWSSDYLNYRS